MSNLNAANFFYINCIIQILSLSKKIQHNFKRKKSTMKKLCWIFFHLMLQYLKQTKGKIMPKFNNEREKEFVLSTSILSLVISCLYIWKGLDEGFYITTYIIISLQILYVPFIFIFKRHSFPYFYLIHSLILTFVIAFSKTFLYNNFTSLLGIFLVILFVPKLKRISLQLYFIATSIAFALNEENLCHYFLHTTCAVWLYLVFNYIIAERYPRKKLILYDDEIKILTELSKNRLQKSIELQGFSESTIYRRIKSACKRNHLSKQQLIEEFKIELEEEKSKTKNSELHQKKENS